MKVFKYNSSSKKYNFVAEYINYFLMLKKYILKLFQLCCEKKNYKQNFERRFDK